MKFGKDGLQTCGRSACVSPAGTEATWYPMLRIFAKGYKFSPPLQSIIALPVCENCSKISEVSDFITDEGWMQICDFIFSSGGAAPDRSRTQLAWWKISDAQAGKLPR